MADPKPPTFQEAARACTLRTCAMGEVGYNWAYISGVICSLSVVEGRTPNSEKYQSGISVLAGCELITGLRRTAAENVSGYWPITIVVRPAPMRLRQHVW